ncbi:MAG: IS3 family transposase [Succinivibrionaceae bacterium]
MVRQFGNLLIQWYNNVRIKNKLGGLIPVQYRLSNVK